MQFKFDSTKKFAQMLLWLCTLEETIIDFDTQARLVFCACKIVCIVFAYLFNHSVSWTVNYLTFCNLNFLHISVVLLGPCKSFIDMILSSWHIIDSKTWDHYSSWLLQSSTRTKMYWFCWNVGTSIDSFVNVVWSMMCDFWS